MKNSQKKTVTPIAQNILTDMAKIIESADSELISKNPDMNKLSQLNTDGELLVKKLLKEMNMFQ